MENPKKELIEEVVDLFEDYQETYVPGEWESFSKNQKKKHAFVIPLWMKIAAVLIVIVAVVPLVWRNSVDNETVAVTKKKEGKDAGAGMQKGSAESVKSGHAAADKPMVIDPLVNRGSRNSGSTGGRIGEQVEGNTVDAGSDTQSFAGNNVHSFAGKKLINKNAVNGAVDNNVPVVVNANVVAANVSPVIANNNPVVANSSPVAVSSSNVVAINGNVVVANNNPVAANNKIADKSLQADIHVNDKFAKAVTADTVKRGKVSTIDFLLAESKQPFKKTKRTDTKSKWDFGVEVAPAATRANVNIGGGLTTAYRLSDKFSLSTGISLLQLDADRKDPSAGKYGPMSSPVPSYDSPVSGSPGGGSGSPGDGSDKQLLAVNANIKAIDIPISVIYKFDQRYYTSIGVSYFNVIGEKRNNTFMQTSRVNEDRINPATGQFYTKLISSEVEEQGKETPLRGNSYLGFFNFSLGRRQSLFNKYNILIEPFIKVPIGKLSDEDLRLMNSGIKFQVSF